MGPQDLWSALLLSILLVAPLVSDCASQLTILMALFSSLCRRLLRYRYGGGSLLPCRACARAKRRRCCGVLRFPRGPGAPVRQGRHQQGRLDLGRAHAHHCAALRLGRGPQEQRQVGTDSRGALRSMLLAVCLHSWRSACSHVVGLRVACVSLVAAARTCTPLNVMLCVVPAFLFFCDRYAGRTRCSPRAASGSSR